jgi:hypothetical protein
MEGQRYKQKPILLQDVNTRCACVREKGARITRWGKKLELGVSERKMLRACDYCCCSRHSFGRVLFRLSDRFKKKF